jgi:hypothetical protein
MNSRRGFVMSHPVYLLEKHLANIYARIDKIERELADFMESMTDGVDSLEREKLTAREFHEYVDEFNKALVEGLSSLGEPVRESAKEETVKVLIIEEPEKKPTEVAVQAIAGGGQQLTDETEEVLYEELAKKEKEEPPSVESPAATEVIDQKLVEKLSNKYLHPELALKYLVDLKMRHGKMREQAIREIEEENR